MRGLDQALLAIVAIVLLSSAGCEAEGSGAAADVDPAASPEVAADAPADVPADAPADAPDEVSQDSGPAAAELPYSLVSHPAWVEAALDVDPFYDPRAGDADVCPEGDWFVETTPEGTRVEVDTTFCAWLTLRQPTLEPVPAGATVRVLASHDQVFEGGGPFLMQVGVGEPPQVLWETTVDVPQSTTVYDETWVAPVDLPAGAPIYWHLENHGDNHWQLVRVEVVALP